MKSKEKLLEIQMELKKLPLSVTESKSAKMFKEFIKWVLED